MSEIDVTDRKIRTGQQKGENYLKHFMKHFLPLRCCPQAPVLTVENPGEQFPANYSHSSTHIYNGERDGLLPIEYWGCLVRR